MSVITGIPDPWLQPSEYGRNEVGQFATVPYEGTDPDQINRLAAQFDRLGYRYRVSHGFGKHRLEVYLSYNPDTANEQAVDLWEYVGSKAQKDLLASSVQTGITGTLSQKNIELIRQCLSNDFANTADTKTLTQADFTDGSPANALTLYNLMKAGVTDSIVRAPNLRHTQTVSFIYPITLAKLNVGRIISTATLLTLENTPTWATAGLPTDVPPSFVTIATAFGWYKNDPTIQQIAGQKYQIVQEYEYGLWATAIWGAPL